MVGADSAGRLRVRVRESPVDGQANRALVVLLADLLGIPKSAVRIVSGLEKDAVIRVLMGGN